MDDPQNVPEPPHLDPAQASETEPGQSLARPLSSEETAKSDSFEGHTFSGSPANDSRADITTWKRNFRHNLTMLLALTLAAFALTAWILIRVDSPFGIFSSGPQEIVRAQLRAVDLGELRPAYDMFSARYRGQVSFDLWHQLIVTHWRMFHGDVVRSETRAEVGPGVTLEIYVRGADEKDYRARFTLIRAGGRWWIDDVHWSEDTSERGLIVT